MSCPTRRCGPGVVEHRETRSRPPFGGSAVQTSGGALLLAMECEPRGLSEREALRWLSPDDADGREKHTRGRCAPPVLAWRSDIRGCPVGAHVTHPPPSAGRHRQFVCASSVRSNWPDRSPPIMSAHRGAQSRTSPSLVGTSVRRGGPAKCMLAGRSQGANRTNPVRRGAPLASPPGSPAPNRTACRRAEARRRAAGKVRGSSCKRPPLAPGEHDQLRMLVLQLRETPASGRRLADCDDPCRCSATSSYKTKPLRDKGPRVGSPRR